jgi:hypothetical protein
MSVDGGGASVVLDELAGVDGSLEVGADVEESDEAGLDEVGALDGDAVTVCVTVCVTVSVGGAGSEIVPEHFDVYAVPVVFFTGAAHDIVPPLVAATAVRAPPPPITTTAAIRAATSLPRFTA